MSLNDKLNFVGNALSSVSPNNVGDAVTLIIYVYTHLQQKEGFRKKTAKACNCIGQLLRQPALQDLVECFLEADEDYMKDCPEPGDEKAPFYVRDAYFNLLRSVNPKDEQLPENQKKEE